MTPEQRAMLSSALRHARDAEILLAEDAFDGAWHLAGFAQECARKVGLSEGWSQKLLGHGVGNDAEQALELLLAMDGHAARLRLEGWGGQGTLLAQWTPEVRYAPTGTILASKASGLTAQSRERVDAVAQSLWCNGLVDSLEL